MKNRCFIACTALVAGLMLAPPASHAGWNFGWRPANPVANVQGGCPIESPDGLTLFTAGGFDGTLDIWIYERDSKSSPFGPRIKVDDPVSLDDAGDFCPTPLDGEVLFFVSDRDDETSCGGVDIFVTRFKDGAASEPRRLACAPHGPNTAGRELAPSLVYTRHGAYLYYSTNGPNGDQDIHRSRMYFDGSFGPGEPVHDLNTSHDDQQPNLSLNGREIVFSSNRAGEGQDVYTAFRVRGGWTRPRNLSKGLNLPTVDGNETRASLSRDRRSLYYGSGGTIFVSKRGGFYFGDDNNDDD